MKYARELNSFFSTRPGLDLVLLGIGDDGHTASLFPGTPSLKEKEHPAIAVPPSGTILSDRITITFPIINNAENILFMAAGDGKAPVIRKVIEEKKQGEALVTEQVTGNHKKLFIESYGCQMNLNDSEIVASILANEGFNTTQILEEADLVLVNTCSIRDKAEQTVRKRLQYYNKVKKINPSMKVGVLGCMAERIKTKFLE